MANIVESESEEVKKLENAVADVEVDKIGLAYEASKATSAGIMVIAEGKMAW